MGVQQKRGSKDDGEQRRKRVAKRPRAPNILLAEDDPDMRALHTEALQKDGYDVVEVDSGTWLVELIGNRFLGSWNNVPIDAIISDFRMPGLTGLQVLAGFRRVGWSTPFVLITAFGEESFHAEAKRLGATAVLDKPFDMEDLRKVLAPLLPPNSAVLTITPRTIQPERTGREVTSSPCGTCLALNFNDEAGLLAVRRDQENIERTSTSCYVLELDM